ncbi:MAG TPA: hypothetical protein VML19_16595 [Verrucomicrobiae bacterium]|nr:hypothetical protein [Verrucomicrobiae bacterium]
MIDVLDSLILDLLEWVDLRVRTYEEVMGAWRTSCPRFPVWEDATDRGLVRPIWAGGREVVRITPAGRELLRQQRPRINARPGARTPR